MLLRLIDCIIIYYYLYDQLVELWKVETSQFH